MRQLLIKSMMVVKFVTLIMSVSYGDDGNSGALKFNPAKIFTGTFQMGYEHQVAESFTVSLTGMGTFLTDNPINGWYLGQLGREEFGEGGHFEPASIVGGGVVLQGRNYFYEHGDIPRGLYFGPISMYRYSSVTSEREVVGETEDMSTSLQTFSLGMIGGAQMPFISRNFVFDIYGGPVFKGSSYSDESGLSEYSSLIGLDHTGLTFTFGLSIGLVL